MSSTSASDIITYIGVPLTILSLLPLAYNAVVTIIHLYKIKQELNRNYVSARIHSDLFNRIIEVKFTKYLIQSPQSQLDTTEDGSTDDGANNTGSIPLVHKMPAKRSEIVGGTWTYLNWDRQELRSKTQRTQPGDVLRQPQAQVRFWDLVARLYELKGQPDAKGWSELQKRPLWARGLPLMTVKTASEASALILRVAAPEESDGPVSFELFEKGPKVDWSSLHQHRERTPAPGCFRLPLCIRQNNANKGADVQTLLPVGLMDCRITDVGLTVASESLPTHVSRDIKHLQIPRGESREGIWFASFATAFYAKTTTPILDYKVPVDIRKLVEIIVIPDGAVKLLFASEVVGIPTKITRRLLSEQKRPVQNADWHGHQQPTSKTDEEVRREIEIRRQRHIEGNIYMERIRKALEPPLVRKEDLQQASVDWLCSKGFFSEGTSVDEASKFILSSMVTDQEFSAALCQILEQWATWIHAGTMKVKDFCIMNQEKAMFAQASLVVANLSVFVNGPASALISMQECASKWEYVELG